MSGNISYNDILYAHNKRLVVRILEQSLSGIFSKIDRAVFDNTVRAEIDFIYSFLQTEGKIPDLSTFCIEFPSFLNADEDLYTNESTDVLIDRVLEGYKVNLLYEMTERLRLMDSANYTPDAMLSYLRDTAAIGLGQGNIRQFLWTDDISEEYKRRGANDKQFYSTGFKEIDDFINGYSSEGRELAVVIGRTGHGKSWFLLKNAQAMASAGVRVGFVSPELFETDVKYRIDSLQAGFPLNLLMRGKLEADDEREYFNYCSRLKAGGFFMSITTSESFNYQITVDKLRAYCVQNRLEVLLIDGFSYLSDFGGDKYESLTHKYERIANKLFYLSKELKIPIIISVQSNRVDANKDKDAMPELWNIRDSDGINYNATLVLSVKYDVSRIGDSINKRFRIKVLKNRRGGVGDTCVYNADLNIGKFEFDSYETGVSSVSFNKPAPATAKVQRQSFKVVSINKETEDGF